MSSALVLPYLRPTNAAHLGNDTFLFSIGRENSTRRDQEEPKESTEGSSFYLCTSSFEESIRVVNAHVDRALSLEFDPVQIISRSLQRGPSGTADPFVLHSFFPSPDGKNLAIIAQTATSEVLGASEKNGINEGRLGTLRHYLIKMTDAPFRVFEWRTPPGRTVRSVTWKLDPKPVSAGETCGALQYHTQLLLLLDSGKLLSYNTSVSRVDVALQNPKQFYCECLFAAHTSSLAPPNAAGSINGPLGSSAKLCNQETSNSCDKKGSFSVPLGEVVFSDTKTNSVSNSNPKLSKVPNHFGVPATKVSQPCSADLKKQEETTPKHKHIQCQHKLEMPTRAKSVPSSSEEGEAAHIKAFKNQLCKENPAVGSQIVDISLMKPTRSLPPVLLLLTSAGDVFSVKVDTWGLPLVDDETTTQDGRLTLRQNENEKKSDKNPGMPMAHHLVKGRGEAAPNKSGASSDSRNHASALAVRGALLDEDTGLHAIVVLYDKGRLSVTLADEPQLLARDAVVSEPGLHRTSLLLPTLEPQWHIQLGPSIGSPHHSAISKGGPNYIVSPSVQMELQHHVILVRYDEDSAYLVALPTWNASRGGWCHWQPDRVSVRPSTEADFTESGAEVVRKKHLTVESVSKASSQAAGVPCIGSLKERQREALRWSLTSTAAAVPPPISLRIPFRVGGFGMALGPRELLLVPSTYSPSAKVISVELSTLLRGARFAACADWELTLGYPTHDAEKKKEVAKAPLVGSLSTSQQVAALSVSEEELNRPWTKALCEITLAYRAIFSGEEEKVADHTAKSVELIETLVSLQEAAEQEVEQREAALQKRVAQLQYDTEVAATSLYHWLRVMQDSLAHQRGAAAIHTANHRLGIIHCNLMEMEKKLSVNKKCKNFLKIDEKC